MLSNKMQVQKAGRKRTCQRRGNTARICLQVCTNDFTFLVSLVRLREKEERLAVSRLLASQDWRLGDSEELRTDTSTAGICVAGWWWWSQLYYL